MKTILVPTQNIPAMKSTDRCPMSLLGPTEKFSKRADIFRSSADNRHPRRPVGQAYYEMALHVLAYNLTRVMNIVGIKPFLAAIRA
jgi:hypothetical protein